MIEPSDFGLFLREKRKAAHLTQDDLAVVINKSGQYISDYLMKHRKLLDLINYGLENNVNDKRWAEMLTAISGGK